MWGQHDGHWHKVSIFSGQAACLRWVVVGSRVKASHVESRVEAGEGEWCQRCVLADTVDPALPRRIAELEQARGAVLTAEEIDQLVSDTRASRRVARTQRAREGRKKQKNRIRPRRGTVSGDVDSGSTSVYTVSGGAPTLGKRR